MNGDEIGFTMVMGSTLLERYPIIFLRKNDSDEGVIFNINDLEDCSEQNRMTPYICKDVPIDMIKGYARMFNKWVEELEGLGDEL